MKGQCFRRLQQHQQQHYSFFRACKERQFYFLGLRAPVFKNVPEFSYWRLIHAISKKFSEEKWINLPASRYDDGWPIVNEVKLKVLMDGNIKPVVFVAVAITRAVGWKKLGSFIRPKIGLYWLLLVISQKCIQWVSTRRIWRRSSVMKWIWKPLQFFRKRPYQYISALAGIYPGFTLLSHD